MAGVPKAAYYADLLPAIDALIGENRNWVLLFPFFAPLPLACRIDD